MVVEGRNIGAGSGSNVQKCLANFKIQQILKSFTTRDALV